MRDVFSEYYQNNFWQNDESVSGHGSSLDATKSVREILPIVFREYGVKTLLDIPCGDFYWFQKLQGIDWDVVTYIGADIVPELIAKNKLLYPQNNFLCLDITKDKLPKVDMILCRDLLGHFSNYDVQLALRNIKASGAKYLLATTFPQHETNGDILTGEWRPINLGSLFGLPNPEELWLEGCDRPGFTDKALGLWDLTRHY